MHLGARRSTERCDFCRTPLATGERGRFVWRTEVGEELVLAELCDRCARQADALLEIYGGRGRGAIRLTQAASVSGVERRRVRAVGGTLVRGLVYVLIGLAAFALVTFLTARG